MTIREVFSVTDRRDRNSGADHYSFAILPKQLLITDVSWTHKFCFPTRHLASWEAVSDR